MSSAEHVFDVVILQSVEGGLPYRLYRVPGIVARDEDAAKLKAVDEARQVLGADVVDPDKIEVLVTRPFKPDCATIVSYPAPYYVPSPWVPTPCYPEPWPYWYGRDPVWTSGLLSIGDNTTDETVIVGELTTGSTTDER